MTTGTNRLILPLTVDMPNMILLVIPAGDVLTIVEDRGDIVRVRWGIHTWNMSRALLDYATGRRDAA